MFPFDWFFILSLVAFFVVLGVSLTVFIIFLRLFRRRHENQSTQDGPSVVIKEVVKIRCPYCSKLYDEKYDKCPHCGGKRKN
jgi:hypothetical protein